MILFKLFCEFLKIGSFSFGGGMSTLPYMYEMARNTGWITEERITNLISMSQVTPGPIGCNIGTVVGLNTSGIIGAIVCNFAFIIPNICFVGVAYKFFNKIQKSENVNEVIKVIRSAALAIILSSSITIFQSAFLNENGIINYKSIILGLFIYLISKYKKINSILLIIISASIAAICRV